MTDSVTTQDIFNSHQKQLGLNWIAGEDCATGFLKTDYSANSDSTLIGYLNLVRPNLVQILGTHEVEYLNNLGKNSYQDTFLNLLTDTLLVIITDGLSAPTGLLEQARKSNIPVFSATASGNKVIDHLRYYLTNRLATKVVKHGVFMEVFGIGTLLTGPSGVGKSELALELLSRGHRLIADDAPEFSRVAPDTISGTCPNLLIDFLEIRGLGIINVRAMFGNNAILTQKRLRLIIKLDEQLSHKTTPMERLDNTGHYQKVLDVDIPEVTLPVGPGRDLAVIIEAAVRNHVLYLNGYNAAQDFIERQQAFINKKQS